MQWLSRLPGGAGIVFGVGVAICVFFWFAKRHQAKAAVPHPSVIPSALPATELA